MYILLKNECATSGLPDLTSDSCDENCDDRNTTSSSQEDLESVQLDEGTSSGDTAASQSVNAGYK